MKMIFLCALVALTTNAFICNKDEEDLPGNSHSSGKHRFMITVNGDVREYFVHVPKRYDAITPLPVVFMLHGSGGNGEKFYNTSGWKELGETQHVLTVFPSSWQYECIYDDGVQKHHAEKWNSYDLEFCNGETPKDDIKFLSQVIDALKREYAIDEKRIYMAGFSNGGEMASRAAIELSHRLAAVVACSGTLPLDTSLTPARKLPILLQAGNSDSKLLAKLGTTSPLPMDFDQLFSAFPDVRRVADAHINAFNLQSTFSAGGDPATFIYADYPGVSGKRTNVFRFMLVRGLGHSYPNGTNHPVKGAEVHWEWMRQYKL